MPVNNTPTHECTRSELKMCLATPMKIVSVEPGELAWAELNGVRQRISIALLDAVEPGDFVIVHVGHALSRLDEEEAEQTLLLLQQSGEMGEGTP